METTRRWYTAPLNRLCLPHSPFPPTSLNHHHHHPHHHHPHHHHPQNHNCSPNSLKVQIIEETILLPCLSLWRTAWKHLSGHSFNRSRFCTGFVPSLPDDLKIGDAPFVTSSTSSYKGVCSRTRANSTAVGVGAGSFRGPTPTGHSCVLLLPHIFVLHVISRVTHNAKFHVEIRRELSLQTGDWA